jgi:hypothetical protein
LIQRNGFKLFAPREKIDKEDGTVEVGRATSKQVCHALGGFQEIAGPCGMPHWIA